MEHRQHSSNSTSVEPHLASWAPHNQDLQLPVVKPYLARLLFPLPRQSVPLKTRQFWFPQWWGHPAIGSLRLASGNLIPGWSYQVPEASPWVKVSDGGVTSRSLSACREQLAENVLLLKMVIGSGT